MVKLVVTQSPDTTYSLKGYNLFDCHSMDGNMHSVIMLRVANTWHVLCLQADSTKKAQPDAKKGDNVAVKVTVSRSICCTCSSWRMFDIRGASQWLCTSTSCIYAHGDFQTVTYACVNRVPML